MSLATFLIGLVAAFFLGMGLFGLAAPAALVRTFGISLGSVDARTEMRAVYGGFGVAMAGLLALAAADIGNIRRGAAISVAVALLGMAGGRLVARSIERPTSFYPIHFYFWVELLLASMLLTAVVIR